MKIAIIDDEKRYREKIKKCVESIIPDVEITLYECGSAFIEDMGNPEIAFVDIEMPDIDGFETIMKAKKINPETKFVITTTHTELSRKGYQVNAFRYIDKTMMEDEIREAIDSYIDIRKEMKTTEIHIMGKKHDVSIGDILYFETQKRKVQMVTNTGSFICDDNINELYRCLNQYYFYMPFRSSIVNLKYVLEFDKHMIKMTDGHQVNLSRRKYEEFKGIFFEYKFKKSNM